MTLNKLLISTMLKVIYYDGQDHHIIDSGELSEGNAHYTGITWDDRGVFYVAGCKATTYGIYAYDKNDFQKYGFSYSADLHETHQMFYQNEKLYCVNTGLNRIEVLCGSGEIKNKSFNESTCDIDHLNSIWSDGERFYISEFRHKQEGQPSVVRVCDLDLNLLETIEIGLPIHNVYVEENRIYNLVSREAGIVTTHLELKNKRSIPLPELQGMLLRGLARTESKWYIGASRWEPDRTKRVDGDGIILVLDNDFKKVDKIVMPDVGPICDIRVIDELDLAHNRIPFIDKRG